MFRKLLISLKLISPTVEDLVLKAQTLGRKADRLQETRKLLREKLDKAIVERHNG